MTNRAKRRLVSVCGNDVTAARELWSASRLKAEVPHSEPTTLEELRRLVGVAFDEAPDTALARVLGAFEGAEVKV